jgi:thiosulfate/3-mercaptopyruvate sulfurtransferase
MEKPLVSCEWLSENMNLEDLIILDASPLNTATGNRTKFENKVIPGARYFDLKNVFSESDCPFPNTFPTIEQFEHECQEIGINNSSKIVIYDNIGIYTSPRVWWMFKTMGHEDVAVLDGGLSDWILANYETQTSHSKADEKGDFTCKLASDKIVDIDFIDANISRQDHLVIDARSEGRFNGIIKEPRPGLRSGHIPNSLNIPFESLLKDGSYKSEAELTRIFQDIGIDERPLSFSCGSGVTACILLLAAELVLKNNTSIYDGSWTEWASLK